MSPLLKDAHWVRQSFLVRKDQLDADDFKDRTFSTASLKFTDTTPGGNFAINPPPQFTRTADIRQVGRLNRDRYRGMGRYYSEAIDDNSQLIYMRFGMPKFNSMSQFFTGFYSSSAGMLARTGRADSVFYDLGKAAGFVVSVISWKLVAVQMLFAGINFAQQKPSSKFYYLKPTMPVYWQAVATMINQIAVNRGIVPRVGGSDQQGINGKYEFDKAALTKLHELLPDIFDEGGGIDVFAMANRAQRLAHKHQKSLQQAAEQGNTNIRERWNELNSEKLEDSKPFFRDYMQRWFGVKASQPKSATATSGMEPIAEEGDDGASWLDFLKAEMDDGAAFACFRVNSTGQVQESFSSSVTESELSNKLNSMSSSSRSTSFSFANGNIVGGMLGEAIGSVTSAVGDVLRGVGDALQISGLAALAGSAFVDIPKHWQSSSANLPTMSYTINLVSPYGNPISQLINLYVPLCMLLAAALPISTGRQSYGSPFILELYDKGRCQTRLGMIDSLTITRGTGNLGFDNDGHAMGIDVSFSVVDMSSILHMPITQGFAMNTAGAAAGAIAGARAGVVGAAVGAAAGGFIGAAAQASFDEDTVFSDYMAVLGSMGLADQIYPMRKLKLNLTKQLGSFDQLTSAAAIASFAGDTLPARAWSAVFFKGVER